MPAPSSRDATRFVCDADGVRLDRFITDRTAAGARRRTAAIIAAGAVRVNGRPARKGQLLERGDVVEIDPAALATAPPAGQAELGLPILYEDEALIAVDKPAGMPAVALRDDDVGTVANFLLGYAPETVAAARTALEAGLVHRLDTGTSGVLLAARTAEAWANVRDQFRRRAVEKRYLAWVDGVVARPGSRHEPIAHHPRRPQLMRACPDADQARDLRARPALTRYQPVDRRGGATLLAIDIATGVRHQIRVHLAAAGHPVCGDPLYGGSAAARLMLHAAALSLRHPLSGTRLSLECLPPSDFTAPA